MLQIFASDKVVMAVDPTGAFGGLARISAKTPAAPIQIEVVPLVELKGRFTCEESGTLPGETYTSLSILPGNLRIAATRSGDSTFALKMPPGRYQLRSRGSERFEEFECEVTLEPGRAIDLGTGHLKLTALGRLAGKPAPPLSITDAREVSKNVKLTDFQGKWVVLDFWGFWCPPCVGQSLSGWVAFADAHAADRDQFVILAVHDPQATDFAMLDDKLKPIIRRNWRGRALPFPILLDTTGQTVKDYGVVSWPTVVIIDPEGRVVDVPEKGGFTLEDFLASKLPPLTAAERIAAALDGELSFRARDVTFARLMEIYDQTGHVRVRLDPDELKKLGIDKDTRVPVSLGARLSLRAWLNLTLEPFGLTYVADSDDLRVVRRSPENMGLSRPSPKQERDNAAIAETLKEKVTFDFRDESLEKVVEALSEKTGESFVLDPVGRRSGAIKPEATLTGSAVDEPLDIALKRLLAPLKMTYVVRDEAVVLTPAP